MWFKPFAGRTTVIGGVLILGITVSMSGFSFAKSLFIPHPNSLPIVHKIDFPKNQNGQTYGSDMYSTSLATEPDLILTQGVDANGHPIIGYVLKQDEFLPMPKTPAEAVAMDRKPGSVRKIPLYAVNGKTVIGTFSIG
ncbi:hypothetical protein [Ferroacidibacillus organovorans]|uniref:Peptidase M56 BlaR1 n=1 Tax=Ferroacidibacillus organovorans TaxID=1765683 RepID=A0A853KD79_9BACL|nr:hypothetical protein [Ferroacidibacillus organovorans]KYP82070.1 hypothetical protein AYJ22_05060 [Ferroacidibacillus organovorans]OAG94391.1 hypothetical protein AYW79_05885 [Ferroacidibacillus organovorans]